MAPFLFTKLLTPILTQTAQTAPLGSVRVIWVSSLAAELASPKGGLDMNNLDYKKDQSPSTKYAISKAGNVLHSQQYSRLHKEDRIVSLVR
jgi:retinol dehydrogenase 12